MRSLVTSNLQLVPFFTGITIRHLSSLSLPEASFPKVLNLIHLHWALPLLNLQVTFTVLGLVSGATGGVSSFNSCCLSFYTCIFAVSCGSLII